MRNIKFISLIIGFVFAGLLTSGCCMLSKAPCAGGCDKGSCASGTCAKGASCDKGSCGSKCPFESCLMKSTCCALKGKEELGLSEDQVAKIEELGQKTKKDVIQRKADVEALDVDLKSLMKSDEFDAGAINALIDKKSDMKKAIMKTIVNSHAEFLSVLNDEQKTKFREMKKNCKKGCSGK